MADVKKVYTQLLSQGYTEKDAAKEAQSRTGMSAVTGKPINRQLKETSKSYKFGQYTVKK